MMATSLLTVASVTTSFVENTADIDLPTNNGNKTTEIDKQVIPEDIAIWLVNEKLSSINRPCIYYLVICVVLGIIGNSLVLYIHSKAVKRNVAVFFIMCLATFDIFSCLALIFEIFDRRFPMYSGNLPVLCKAVRYIEVCSNGCSIGVLICISFDRYYKICKPLKSFSLKKAKITLVIVSCISVFIASPSILFYGTETIELGYKYVKGHDCADDDLYKHTIYPSVFFLTFFVCMLVSFMIIIMMYIRVFVAIRNWKRQHIGEFISETTTSNNNQFEYNDCVENGTKCLPTTVASDVTPRNNTDLIVIRRDRTTRKKAKISDISNLQNKSNRSRCQQSNSPPPSPKCPNKVQKSLKTRVRVSRMTVILGNVTLVFILSYFPYFIIEILNALELLNEEKLTLPLRQLVVISNASYSLSYIANPIIYSFMNPAFRAGIKSLLFGLEPRHKTMQSFEKLRTTLSNIRHV